MMSMMMQLHSSNTNLLKANRYLLKAVGYPIEITKTIIAQDGIAGFWRGLPPTLVRIIPS
jgi:hypothetical protein